jgi:hypothetical protein
MLVTELPSTSFPLFESHDVKLMRVLILRQPRAARV